MSDNRELVELLAAIDATPRASWVTGLRADLDAAWEIEDAGYLDSLRTTVSLVDHVSFILMRDRQMRTAFAFDRDFADQGFEVLGL